jgi:lipoprotein-anchoring transpeptidase ErfK/SrfK
VPGRQAPRFGSFFLKGDSPSAYIGRQPVTSFHSAIACRRHPPPGCRGSTEDIAVILSSTSLLRPAFVLTVVGLTFAGCVSKTPAPAAIEPVAMAKPLYLANPDDTADNPLDKELSGNQEPPDAFRHVEVDYTGPEAPGTIVIDTKDKYLYFVEDGGKAQRYGVGVGREGFGWRGEVQVGSKQKWPRWFPPKEMIAREHARGHMIPDMMEGQVGNPLGARAMYLYDGSKDTLFRIHGTFEPQSIGTNASSGCFRMANDDVIDLYDRVTVGTHVVVK